MSTDPTEQHIWEQENLINQDFSESQLLKKLLTDIPQIPCHDEKLYISPILDCYNREIISLIMRDNLKKELYIDTFHDVTKRYKLDDCILYSNRGSSIPVKHLENHYPLQE